MKTFSLEIAGGTGVGGSLVNTEYATIASAASYPGEGEEPATRGIGIPSGLKHPEPTLPTSYLRPPREHSGMIARPSLTGRIINAVLNKHLVLVTAPSGYGKTTLLADAYRQLDSLSIPHIWISVTDSDRDPMWLDQMMKEQLSEFCQLPALDGEKFSTFASRLARRQQILVIIDNWNFIDGEATNTYFDTLLNETAGLVNFIVGSRKTPGFVFEIYRMNDDCAEFGPSDLALSLGDCENLLQKTLSAPVPASMLRSLVARTEGWPAGVQLLRLALNRQGETATSSIQFSGSRTDVAEYLNKTLFSHLSPERRALLCNLAVLNEVSRELAVAVMQSEKAGVEFAALQRDNFFLNEISERSQRFRFHSLFRDFLLLQHANEASLDKATIFSRAARWHLSRDEHVAAISYAIRACDAEIALTLLESYAKERLLADARIFLFTEWIGELIAQGVQLTPLLDHWYRWSLVFTGRWSVALELGKTDETSRETIIDAVIGAFRDDQSGLQDAINRWAVEGTSADNFSKAVMHAGAAAAHMARGNFKGAAQSINRAKFTIGQTEGGFGRTWVQVLSALLALLRGNLLEARTEIADAVHLSEKMLRPNSPTSRMARLTSAIIAYHAGDTEQARIDLGFANTSIDEHGLPLIVILASAIAQETGVSWEERPVETRPPSAAMALIADALRVDMAIRGNMGPQRMQQQVEAFEARLEAAEESTPHLLRQGWILADFSVELSARAALAQGDFEQVSRLITPKISACQRDGRGFAELPYQLLRVATLYRQGNHAAALRLLIQQAEKAVQDRYWRPFISYRHLIEPLLPALFDAGKRSPLGNDAEAWREFSSLLGNKTAASGQSPDLLGKLDKNLEVTSRETEILRFLDGGLSNSEIGDRLGISVPTVKWHLNNLFSKIGVRNRMSAVRFARDNRLI